MRPTTPLSEDRLSEIFSEDEWETVISYGELFECKANDRLYHQGDVSDRLMLVLSGRVSLCRELDGKETRMGTIRVRGETISGAGFFLETPRRLGSCVDDDGTRILVFERKRLFELCRELRPAMEFFFKNIASQLFTAIDYIRQIRELPIEKRVGLRIYNLYAEVGKIELTQSQLSSYLSLSRVSVSKVLGGLEDAGLIKRRYGRISVLDSEGLRNWLDLPELS